MRLLFLPFLFLTSFVYAQEQGPVDLIWKVSDTLVYTTLMTDVVIQDSIDENSQKDTLFDEILDAIEKMQDHMSDLNYVTFMYPDGLGNIEIEMSIDNEGEKDPDNPYSQLAEMNGNVLLRGKISPRGELISTYYKRAQSNLIAILFELPTKSIKIGDE